MRNWKANVVYEEAAGEYLLTFPTDMLKELDWKIGDDISVDTTDDGGIILKNESKNK